MSVYLQSFKSEQLCTISTPQVIFQSNIMNEELTCKLCTKTFRFQIEKSFHFDVVHNFHYSYRCENCENSEDWEDKGFRYTYFELLDHIFNCHEENPYMILKCLNIY